jgi:multidrug efflux pump subunit AcrA (membrane-fusion protein)
MPKEIKIKRAAEDFFSEQDASWMALDLPQVKPPMYANAFIFFLAGFFSVGLTYSALTEVPVVVESAGRLVTEKPAVPIRALTNFTVDSVTVRENQEVKAGALLVISSDGLKPEEVQMVANLKREIKFLSSQRTFAQCPDCSASLRNAAQMSRRLSRQPLLAQTLQPVSRISQGLLELENRLQQKQKSLQPQMQRLAQLSRGQGGRFPASSDRPLQGEAGRLQRSIRQELTPEITGIEKLQSHFQGIAHLAERQLDELAKLGGVIAPFDGRVINIRLKGQTLSV